MMCVVGVGVGYCRRGMVVGVGRGLVLGGGRVVGVWGFPSSRFWVLVGVGVFRVGCGVGRSVVENVGGRLGVPCFALEYVRLV